MGDRTSGLTVMFGFAWWNAAIWASVSVVSAPRPCSEIVIVCCELAPACLAGPLLPQPAAPTSKTAEDRAAAASGTLCRPVAAVLCDPFCLWRISATSSGCHPGG